MNGEILTVMITLGVTVTLLAFEVVRIDITAMLCMLALGWTGILETREMLSGFSSNAVMVMMAVMILGRGIEKTGVMERFSRFVLDKVGNERRKLTGFMMASVGMISGFIQNIGAVALFLPGILNISRRTKLAASELIMPVGFAAILGGTLTMVGSGPLILINDLLRTSGLEPYGIFSVTPVGALLIAAGIVYFFLFGKYVLPRRESGEPKITEQERLIRELQLPQNIWHYAVPEGSPLVGKTMEESGIWEKPGVNLLGICRGRDVEYAPWRETVFETGQKLALLGNREEVEAFSEKNLLVFQKQAEQFMYLHDPGRSGFAEVIVPHHSDFAGKCIREISFRRRFEVEPVMLFSKGKEIRGDFSDHNFSAGDAMVVYGLWERIHELKAGNDFVVATPYEMKTRDQSKTRAAVFCFLFSIGLALAGFSAPMAFFSGAVAMVLAGVIEMKEAYQAIEWKVVFLLAGLIPMGLAMEKTGTARFLAENVVSLVAGQPLFVVVLTVAVLTTLFSLFMTNVGAIVVLAPLVIGIAEISGLDARPLALLAAVCAANSFVLPTHQVNAFIMTSGGYRNIDYIKAGSGMTLIFLIIVSTFFSFFYM